MKLNRSEVDDGQRIILRTEAHDESEATRTLTTLIDQRPEGWRLKVASLKCPTDRGRRIHVHVELVSPEWVHERRSERSERQQGD